MACFSICVYFDIEIVRSVDGMEPDNQASNPNQPSNPNFDRIANCEHPDYSRARVQDASVFRENPVNCTYCDTLNGSGGREAVVCTDCTATICENCDTSRDE